AEKRDVLLKIALETQMRPVSFREQAIEVALVEGADPSIIQTLSRRLREWTGQMWGISVARAPATGPTIRDIRQDHQASLIEAAKADPMVKAILEAFPTAKLLPPKIETFDDIPDAAYEEAFLDEIEDD